MAFINISLISFKPHTLPDLCEIQQQNGLIFDRLFCHKTHLCNAINFLNDHLPSIYITCRRLPLFSYITTTITKFYFHTRIINMNYPLFPCELLMSLHTWRIIPNKVVHVDNFLTVWKHLCTHIYEVSVWLGLASYFNM